MYFSFSISGGAFTNTIFGVEVQNDRAFIPGLPTYYSDTADNLLQYALVNGVAADTMEVAIDLRAFTQNGFNIPLYPATADITAVRMDLSQSFGYSVVGGPTAYGTNRLGVTAIGDVPEPASLALVGAALIALGLTRRRRI